MLFRRIAFLICGALLLPAGHAEARYQLKHCVRLNEGVAVGFIGPQGQTRRLSVSKGRITLGGNVKGEGSLSEVRELSLDPVLQISYASGFVVSFGPIDSPCRELLLQVLGPHLPIRGATANPSLHPTAYSGLRPLPSAGELKR